MLIQDVIELIKKEGASAKVGPFLRRTSTTFTRISRADGSRAIHSSVGTFIKGEMRLECDDDIEHLTVNVNSADFVPVVDAVVLACGGMYRAEPRVVPGMRDQKDRVDSYVAILPRLAMILSTDGLGQAKNATLILEKSENSEKDS